MALNPAAGASDSITLHHTLGKHRQADRCFCVDHQLKLALNVPLVPRFDKCIGRKELNWNGCRLVNRRRFCGSRLYISRHLCGYISLQLSRFLWFCRCFRLRLRYAVLDILQLVKNPLQFLFAIIPPVHTPDAQNLPAKSAEHTDLRDFPVAGGFGSAIGGAVQHNTQHILIGILGINHTDINTIFRTAYRQVGLVALFFQSFADSCGDAVIALLLHLDRSFFQCQGSTFCIFQEATQGGYAFCLGAVQIQLFGPQGGEHHHLAPGAGHGNIQPTPASIPV